MTMMLFGSTFGTMLVAGLLAGLPVQTGRPNGTGVRTSDETATDEVPIQTETPRPVATSSNRTPTSRSRMTGKRLGRDEVTERIVPTARLQTRIQNRVQNRLQTRIDGIDRGQTTGSAYAIAEDQVREARQPSATRPR